jgi:hypothetical protein
VVGATAPVTAGLILVGVGSALTLATLDLSGRMLLHVLHGAPAPATLACLGAKKLAELLLFAAFVDVAVGAGLRRGALIGGLALALQPIVSASSGGLTTIAAGAAIVLGGRALAARIAPTIADIVGGALAVAAAIFLSPWLLALLGVTWLPRPGQRRATGATLLLALGVPLVAALLVAFARGDPLPPAVDPAEAVRTFGGWCLASLPPTSRALVALAVLFAARGAAAMVLGSIVASLVTAAVFPLDLGAPFVVAILLAFGVTIAIDRAVVDRPWAANLAAVTVFLFALASTPEPLLQLLRAHQP